jgi:hypothetical protein
MKIIKYKEFENLDVFDEWEDIDDTNEKSYHLLIVELQQDTYHLNEYKLEQVDANIFRYGNDRRVRIDIPNIEINGYVKTLSGVVYKEGEREKAMKALRGLWSGNRGGLTRKINKRRQELDIYERQKESLDRIFN